MEYIVNFFLCKAPITDFTFSRCPVYAFSYFGLWPAQQERRLFLIFIILISTTCCWAQVQLEISSSNQKAVPLLIGGVERKDEKDFEGLMACMKKNFSFTNQFAVETKLYKKIPTKKEVKELSKDYLFAIFIVANGSHFEWRLYDTINGTMVAGKKYQKRGDVQRSWAYNMSDIIWTA